MSQVLTVDAAEAQLNELAKSLIQQLRAQAPKSMTVTVAAAQIEIFEGEKFLGAVLNEDGSVHHYAILQPILEGDFDWDAIGEAAAARGGHRPNRSEGYLIHARLPGKVERWFHLEETSGASGAWHCDSCGGQYISLHSAQGGGVSVRRVFPSAL